MNNDDEWVHNLLLEPDEGFVFGGRTDGGMLIAKTNATGDLLWAQVLEGDEGFGLAHTLDGGYLIAGSEYVEDWGRDVMVYWVDSDGNIVDSKRAGGAEYAERARAVCATPDSGAAVAAFREFTVVSARTVLFKMDVTGQVEWQRQYGTEDNNVSGMVLSPEGGYVMAGTLSPSDYPRDMYLMKLDAAGDVLWIQVYGYDVDDQASDVIAVDGGGYLLLGYGDTDDPNLGKQAIVVRVDENGDEIWTWSYGDEEWDAAVGAVQTADGGFAVCGHRTRSGGQIGSTDARLYKLDANGNLEWVYRSQRHNNDSGDGVVQKADGTLVLGGTWQRTSLFNRDIYLSQMSPEPDPPVLTLVPLNDPIIIPSQGGTVTFTATLANPNGIAVFVEPWAEITLPNNMIYGPLTFNGFWLDPGEQRQTQLSQPVPGGAPAGQYLYQGFLGLRPDLVYASDEFQFSKEGVAGR